jgi:hypothetical protein
MAFSSLRMCSCFNRSMRIIACAIICIGLFGIATPGVANQTPDTTPVTVGGALPYRVELRTVANPGYELPTLHSYIRGEYDGHWVLVAGRTNGLHGFVDDGLINFPPASQNRDVWVIDVENGESWRRSLTSAQTGLDAFTVDSLTSTNAQGTQIGDRLYMTGGYGFDATNSTFRTFNRLTAFDLPELIDWAKGGPTQLSDAFRQVQHPAMQVTGGVMTHSAGRTHLVFGQNFNGPYDPILSGVYTEQIRSFTIQDDGTTLSISNVSSSEPLEEHHRRDLSVVPVIRRDGQGSFAKGWAALSGVFTPDDRAWTVPVEIAEDGTATMADPSAANTFKQGMNIYQTANLGMYSEAAGQMHTLLFGGITYQFYDREAGQFVNDVNFPFTNQVTAVVVDANGNYQQVLLDEEFPVIIDDAGKRMRFGTNGEFFPVSGLPTYDNGVLKLDELSGETRLGYIFGGLMADAGNNGRTAASNFLFEVVLTPVPEPNTFLLAATAGLLLCGGRKARQILLWRRETSN